MAANNKDLFIRLEPIDSIESRRNLLESTEHNIKMMLAVERFKELRKRGIRERNKTRTKIKEILRIINNILEKLPQETEIKGLKRKAKLIKTERELKIPEKKLEQPLIKVEKEEKLQEELEEIKRRLGSLSRSKAF